MQSVSEPLFPALSKPAEAPSLTAIMKHGFMNERPPKSMSGNETTGTSNIQATPGSIFICYRREDTADVTGRIYDRLADHFGPEHVFMDVEAIRLGYDFRSEIDQRIKVCSIVIVVIGDKWLAQVDGKRRIDDENDRVRIEIEAALRREIPIIPVLARGASHPTKTMLPASLEELAYRHGTSIRHEHFGGDVDSLISKMDKLLARQQSTPPKPPPVKSKEPEVWKRKRLIIVTAVAATVILLLLITGSLTRHSFRDAVDIAYLQKAADQGYAPAQNNLGLLYEDGKGVPQDLGEAAELYQKAAHQGYADAQNNLGWLYQNGKGVPQDLGKAAELCQKAANQGYADAQYNLGFLYENGKGVPKNLAKAAELYQKAANQGNEAAIANLKRLSGH